MVLPCKNSPGPQSAHELAKRESALAAGFHFSVSCDGKDDLRQLHKHLRAPGAEREEDRKATSAGSGWSCQIYGRDYIKWSPVYTAFSSPEVELESPKQELHAPFMFPLQIKSNAGTISTSGVPREQARDTANTQHTE